MPLRIDRVETEMEVLRAPETPAYSGDAAGGQEVAGALSGRNALREKLRPIIMDVLHEELLRIQRKVGAP